MGPVRRLASVGLVATSIFASSTSCGRSSQRIAPALTQATLAKIKPGMSREQLVQLLGEPLGKLPDAAIAGQVAYHYATPPMVRLGSHARLLGGLTCIVDVQGEHVQTIWLDARGATCVCSDGECSAGWADKCRAAVPE
jgi:hypothetical protein